jgi:hypothetical protein
MLIDAKKREPLQLFDRAIAMELAAIGNEQVSVLRPVVDRLQNAFRPVPIMPGRNKSHRIANRQWLAQTIRDFRTVGRLDGSAVLPANPKPVDAIKANTHAVMRSLLHLALNPNPIAYF